MGAREPPMSRSMHKAGWLPQPSPAEPGHHRLHTAPDAHLSTPLHPGSTTCRCRGRTRGQTAPLRWRTQAGWGPPQLATQLLRQHCHQLPRPICVQAAMGGQFRQWCACEPVAVPIADSAYRSHASWLDCSCRDGCAEHRDSDLTSGTPHWSPAPVLSGSVFPSSHWSTE